MHYYAVAAAAALWTGVSAAPLNGPLPENNVFDYVIVGGGASSLTVANRLTENPDITVLVIEAGQADSYTYDVMIPAFQGRAGFSPPTSNNCGGFNWCDRTVPQPNLNNRQVVIPQGKGLGGGTLINGLLWNRGDSGDFDDWASLGNQGWDWNSMLPFFERSETFNAQTNAQLASYYSMGMVDGVHGSTGPQNVSFPNFFYNASHYVFQAMQELNVPIVQDPNDGDGKGAMFLPQAISSYNQSRADARRARYDTAADRPNFYVQTGQTVHRIIWDGACGALPDGQLAKALGVEVSPSAGAATWTAVAKREVIMAAGSIRTPQVLELSGVGGNQSVSAGGVQLKFSLPGVGNNLQDHCLMSMDQDFTNSDVLYPNVGTSDDVNAIGHTLYYANRTGPYCFGPPDGNAFPSYTQIGGDAQALASQEAGYSDAQYLASDLDPTVVEGYRRMRPLLNKALTATNRAVIEHLNVMNGDTQISNMRPFTRGTVHIANNDVFTYPTLDYRYLTNPVDRAVLLQALRWQDKLYNTQAMSFLKPRQINPVQHASDDDLNNFITGYTNTEYHPSGTAAMLPLEAGGVVDSNLLVYKTSNVRVIDGSIQPIVPAAHLQAVVYGVAEKAADIIKGAQQGQTPQTPSLPLDTTSCNTGTARAAKRHVAGPHEYTAADLPAPVVHELVERRQTNNRTAINRINGKYGPPPPPNQQYGYYPDYNAPPGTSYHRVGTTDSASKGPPIGAARRWIDDILAGIPSLTDGVVGGINDTVRGLLNGQGILGL